MRDEKLHGVAGERTAPLSGYLAFKVADFAHPRDVLSDPDLDPVEKRAILNAWASDACWVESRPNFCWLPGTPGPVCLSHILAALHTLDVESRSLNQNQGGRVARIPRRTSRPQICCSSSREAAPNSRGWTRKRDGV